MISDLLKEVKEKCTVIECDIYKNLSVILSEDKIISNIDEDKKYSLNDLSKMINLSASRASRIVDSLVKKNILINEVALDDRRKSVIYLSKKGIEMKQSIFSRKKNCESRFKKRFTEIQLSELEYSLKKIIELLS